VQMKNPYVTPYNVPAFWPAGVRQDGLFGRPGKRKT